MWKNIFGEFTWKSGKEIGFFPAFFNNINGKKVMKLSTIGDFSILWITI